MEPLRLAIDSVHYTDRLLEAEVPTEVVRLAVVTEAFAGEAPLAVVNE